MERSGLRDLCATTDEMVIGGNRGGAGGGVWL